MGFFRRKKNDDVLEQVRKINEASNKEAGNSVFNQSHSFASDQFFMIAEDLFTITGRGTVVTGQIKSGEISIGDVVEFSKNGNFVRAKVSGIEMFRKTVSTAKAGDIVGLLFSSISREDVFQGQEIRKADKKSLR